MKNNHVKHARCALKMFPTMLKTLLDGGTLVAGMHNPFCQLSQFWKFVFTYFSPRQRVVTQMDIWFQFVPLLFPQSPRNFVGWCQRMCALRSQIRCPSPPRHTLLPFRTVNRRQDLISSVFYECWIFFSLNISHIWPLALMFFTRTNSERQPFWFQL